MDNRKKGDAYKQPGMSKLKSASKAVIFSGLLATQKIPVIPERESRIASRKSRIESTRLASTASHAQDIINAQKELADRESGRAKLQIITSLQRIETSRREYNQLAIDIRTKVIDRERLRSSRDDKTHESMCNKESEERLNNFANKDIIDKNWAMAHTCSGPYELFELLEKQRLACSALISNKTDIIDEYKAQIKAKEDYHVFELAKQGNEINEFHTQIENSSNGYEEILVEEIAKIEKSLISDRSLVMTRNNDESINLFGRQKLEELKCMADTAARVENLISKLDNIILNDSNDYHTVQIKLETDIHTLERQLEQARVNYQLNSDKLEYNYQVLKKREEENGINIGSQKRKINGLAEHLNILKVKSLKDESNFEQESLHLFDGLEHVKKQYKELQKNSKHFKTVDSKRYKDVWEMSDDDAKALIRKLICADQIICEEQLGIQWIDPSDKIFGFIKPESNLFTIPSESSVDINLINRDVTSSNKIDEGQSDFESESPESQYWSRMRDVINEHSGSNWNTIFDELKRYNTILAQRLQISMKIKVLEVQNQELNSLIEQNIGAA